MDAIQIIWIGVMLPFLVFGALLLILVIAACFANFCNWIGL